MSEITRRTLIKLPAIQLPALAAAQEAGHDHGSQSSTFTKPTRTPFFTGHEFSTLSKLCDCILPDDGVSPAATAAGAPEYIELLSANNAKIAQIFRGGLAWLDSQSRKRTGMSFSSASPADQAALLELVAVAQPKPEHRAGVEFFTWARRMTIDAFYTTPYGYRDVDYKGGHGMTTYTVPPEAIDQVLRKANLK